MRVKKAEDDTKGKERKLPKQVWDCNLMTSETKVTPQRLRVLKLYYQVATSHLPAPPLLRALIKLYYKVASSQLLPTHQFSSSQSPATLRTKVVLPGRQFSSSSSPPTLHTKVVLQSRQFSATAHSPVLIFPLPSYCAY